MMKSLLAGACLAACLTAQALAADQPWPVLRASNYTTYAAPAFNWTGFYAGLQGGYAAGRTSDSGWLTRGALVGGTLGYNYQLPSNVVVGVEGDWSWAHVHGSPRPSIDSNIHWLSTVRGRLGYAYDRFLPYVTGGVAFAKNGVAIQGLGGDSRTHQGWVAGGGLEYAIDRNWSAKIEYLHADIGTKDYVIGGHKGSLGASENIVRAGINYRF